MYIVTYESTETMHKEQEREFLSLAGALRWAEEYRALTNGTAYVTDNEGVEYE